VARSSDQLSEVVRVINSSGGKGIPLTADVSDRRAVEEVVAETETTLGPIDFLVNNAGHGKAVGPLAEVDPDEWWRCQEVNVRGPMLCSRAVLPGMLARRRGRIVNVASGTGARAIPGASAYVVSKTALIRLTENLALEVREHGVTVFAIHPGTVRTAMAEDVLQSEAGRHWLPQFREIFERGLDVTPDYAVRLVLHLASGSADSLTGRLLDAEQDIEKLNSAAQKVIQEDYNVLRVRMLK
jgi:NAD(P)-dependent dehydrogenase (short-subunit alcohol dehydrogenase family)